MIDMRVSTCVNTLNYIGTDFAALPESCWGHQQGHHLAGCRDWPSMENGNSNMGTNFQSILMKVQYTVCVYYVYIYIHMCMYACRCMYIYIHALIQMNFNALSSGVPRDRVVQTDSLMDSLDSLVGPFPNRLTMEALPARCQIGVSHLEAAQAYTNKHNSI